MTIVAGVIGWFASFELLTEYIKTLVNPAYSPNCNVSLLVTCGPNMVSNQGSIFGFTNTILGVAMFVVPIVVGVSLLAGARFASWFWRLYLLGIVFAITFVVWLMITSIFALGTLCPWCMVVWSMTIPLFWYTLLYTAKAGHLWLPEKLRKKFEGIYTWAWVFTVLTYFTVALTAQIHLNWIAEFSRAFS